jgi:hypothetical protein
MLTRTRRGPVTVTVSSRGTGQLQAMSFLRLALRSTATRYVASSSLSRLHQSRLPQRAAFSAASSLDKAQIETRILDVLKSFEKVHPEKVCSGLDMSM